MRLHLFTRANGGFLAGLELQECCGADERTDGGREGEEGGPSRTRGALRRAGKGFWKGAAPFSRSQEEEEEEEEPRPPVKAAQKAEQYLSPLVATVRVEPRQIEQRGFFRYGGLGAGLPKGGSAGRR